MNFKTLRVLFYPKLLVFSFAKHFLYVDVSESLPLALKALKVLMCFKFGLCSLDLNLVIRLK